MNLPILPYLFHYPMLKQAQRVTPLVAAICVSLYDL